MPQAGQVTKPSWGLRNKCERLFFSFHKEKGFNVIFLVGLPSGFPPWLEIIESSGKRLLTRAQGGTQEERVSQPESAAPPPPRPIVAIRKILHSFPTVTWEGGCRSCVTGRIQVSTNLLKETH